jgi:hypothetical protein
VSRRIPNYNRDHPQGDAEWFFFFLFIVCKLYSFYNRKYNKYLHLKKEKHGLGSCLLIPAAQEVTIGRSEASPDKKVNDTLISTSKLSIVVCVWNLS